MKNEIAVENIKDYIFNIRGTQVMIDSDLARMYMVEVKRLNEQVKRNMQRFPESFRFRLNDLERMELVANCDRFETLKHSSINPYAFTEQGISMLSAVLRSKTAIDVSIKIINTFVEMRRFIATNATIFQRLERIEYKQVETDQKFDQIFKAIEDKSIKPKQGVFFDGQVFDAHNFISDLIRKAKTSITIIDNYVDDTVMALLGKKQPEVKCLILTKNISKHLRLDAQKFNKQHGKLEIKRFDKSHDRFLIIDNFDVYHIGMSLKDLGKKWFAFSKLDKDSLNVMDLIKEIE